MVKFIESELVLLKKEIDEMWTLVYNQLDRAGDAVLTLDRELAQQVLVRERRVNAFELKIDSDVEDIIAPLQPRCHRPALCACHAQNTIRIWSVWATLQKASPALPSTAMNRHWILSWSSNSVSKR